LVDLLPSEHAADRRRYSRRTEQTGAKRFKYIKTGENHFSFAFTYAWLAAPPALHDGLMRFMKKQDDPRRRDG